MPDPRLVLVCGPERDMNETVREILKASGSPVLEISNRVLMTPPTVPILMANGVPFRGVHEIKSFVKGMRQ